MIPKNFSGLAQSWRVWEIALSTTTANASGAPFPP
jgi:hypothetical protein